MSITYLAGGRILDQQFGAVAPTVPANYYVGLSTGTIVDAGTGAVEPSTSGTGYARVLVANDKVSWGDAASNALANLIAIAFPQSLAAWGTITNVFLSDSITVGAGNVLYWGVLSPSRVVQISTIVYFDIGDITISLTNV